MGRARQEDSPATARIESCRQSAGSRLGIFRTNDFIIGIADVAERGGAGRGTEHDLRSEKAE